MKADPPDVPKVDDFDREDRETIKAMIAEYRSRKAVRETLKTWAMYLATASGVLIALSQFRDYLKSGLGIK